MKVLVTGASGYLGTHLVKRLLSDRWDVAAFDMRKNEQLPKSVSFTAGDIREKEKVASACKDCNVVFHLVGIMPQAKAKDELMHSINVGGTKNVLDAAVENKVKRVVFLSSCEIYGTWENVPVREEDPVYPIGEYGRNKLEAEKLGKAYSEEHGLEFIALRPSTIVGKNMTDYLFRIIMSGILKSPFFFYIGNGQNRFQMSALNDVVEACLLSSTKDGLKFEVFNIGADNPLSVREQLKQVGEKLGLKRKVVPVPAGLSKTLLRVLSFLNVSPFVPDHFEVMDKDILMDCSKAKKMLGWKPEISNVEMLVEALLSYKYEQEGNHGERARQKSGV